jgi:hypothetical protein
MSIKSPTPFHTISAPATPSVVIRAATDADRAALEQVAERDSSPLPAGELLVAETEGEIRAAVEVDGPRAVADPFRPTAELVDLLHARADQLRSARRRPLRILARTPGPRPPALRRRAA